MKKYFLVLILLFSTFSFTQNELWKKKGITGGIIQDLFKDKNLGFYYIFTDSGIYKSQFLTDWYPINEGLFDFSPIDSAWAPIDSFYSIYAVLTIDGVFAKNSQWSSFKFANSSGLENGGVFLDYQKATHIGILNDDGVYKIYISLEGYGLYYRTFNPSNETNPWGSQWYKDNAYIYNPYISAISSLDGGQVLIVSAINVGLNLGNIYRKTILGWIPVGIEGTNYTTLSKDPSIGNQKIMAGTSQDRIFGSIDGGQNFSFPCSDNGSSLGKWKSLSISTSNGLDYAIGSANGSIYFINPNDCNNVFTKYSYFIGDSNSLFLDENLIAYVGTKGMGLWEYPETNQNGNPIGLTGTNPIKFNNVFDLTLVNSPSRPDVPPIILSASEAEGFYKCFKPNYCTRYFYRPSQADIKTVRGTSLAVVPGYDEYAEVRYSGNKTIIGKKTIFLGTRDFGLFRTDDGGASWKKILNFPIDEDTGKDFEIVKVALAPDFDPLNPGHIFVLTRDSRVFKSIDGGTNWTEEVNLNPSGALLISEDMVISPAYNSGINETQNIFVATSGGIFKRVWVQDHFEWQVLNLLCGSNYCNSKRIALSPCFGFTDCPECSGVPDPLECEKEKSTILVGTAGFGIFYSFDSGTNFFQLNGLNCPDPQLTITSLSFHPRTDIPNAQDRLLNYAVLHTFDASGSNISQFLYIYRNATPLWQCVNADPQNSIQPLRINKVSFQPNFGGDNYLIYLGHDAKGIYKNQHPPTNNWQNLNGFYNVPEKIYSIAECPDDASPNNANKIVLAGTEHYGVMVSFDSGESYFPFSKGFEYVGTENKRFTLHNAESVSCTSIFDPCTSPETCPQHRILASGSDCATFDSNLNCTSKNFYGILYNKILMDQYESKWQQSTLDGNPMNGHLVSEIRYCSSSLPVYASDFGFGFLYSNFALPDGWGIDWHLDTSGDYPIDLTDITCPGGQSGPTFKQSSFIPRGGRGQFIWGAQSGVSQGLRAGNGKAKFKSAGVWYSCTGLSTTANWRSIIMLPSESVLIGNKGESNNLSSGIYKNSQDGTNCDTWEVANMGFTSGDSPQITQNYSKKAVGFAKVSNGVLVALEKGGLNNYEGGIFFSDTDSDGLAWVPVNSGMSCTSNYEVYNGEKIYTGSTCNGVYETDVITYTGYPTAYFTYEKSTNPWYENRVTFYDRSAGLPTGRKWDFDNDSTIDAEPTSRTYTYDFPSNGYNSYNSKIISCQDTYCDSYELSDDGKNPIEFVNTFIPKILKNGSNIRLYWNRVSGGGHTFTYNIYSSSNADGTSASNIKTITDGTSGADFDCTIDPCWYEFNEISNTKYYKIQSTW